MTFSKSTLPALTFTMLLAACGGGSTSEDAPEGATIDTAKLNACELFTVQDALQFNGGRAVAPRSSTFDDASRSGSSLTCSFNTAVSTPDQPQVLGLEIKPARSPKAAARNLESSRAMLKRLAGGEVQEVPGLGEKAMFAGGTLNQLHVLKSNVVLVVTAQTDNQPRSLYLAKLIAERVLQRLDGAPGAQGAPVRGQPQ
ncbi:MAG TPA: hypothetical protein VNM67_15330 [Thermoanaerobaculia bacterium]|jgi:hypothetical protein|nr:hypothetical protein [Thermoanaerobaculia bacterium]